MKVNGRVRFSHYYLEDGLFSYINHLRERPWKFVQLLDERKKFFGKNNPLVYAPPYLTRGSSPPFTLLTKEGTKSVNEAKEYLEKIGYESLPLLDYDNDLGILCKFYSEEEIRNVIKKRKLRSQNLFVISIPFKVHFETSQQILMDLLIDDGNSERTNRNVLFANGVDRIGIGFYPHDNWKNISKNGMEDLHLQIIMCSSSQYEVEQHEKQPSVFKKNNNMRFNIPTQQEFIDHLFLDDHYVVNESITVQDLWEGKKDIRNGMIVQDSEGKTLDFKLFRTSLNINEIIPENTKNFSLVTSSITKILVKYFIGFSNTRGGKLVFGVTDGEKMIDGVFLCPFMEEINKQFDTSMNVSVQPKYDAGKEELRPIPIQSNFKNKSILVLDVIPDPTRFYILKISKGGGFISYDRQEESLRVMESETVVRRLQEVGDLEKKIKPLFQELFTQDNFLDQLVEQMRLRLFSIHQKELTIGKQLGKGPIGVVKECEWKGFEGTVAVKEIILNEDMILSCNNRNQQEEQNLEKLRDECIKNLQEQVMIIHPNVLRIFGFSSSSENKQQQHEQDQQPSTNSEYIIRIIMEKMDMNLSSYIMNTTTRMSFSKKLNMMKKMCDGLFFLHHFHHQHEKNEIILHKNVKSKNFLVSSDGEDIKISDFGNILPHISLSNNNNDNNNNDLKPIFEDGICWVAPEILANEPHSIYSDVYSLGITFYEVLFEKKPYDGIHVINIYNEVKKGNLIPNLEIQESIEQCPFEIQKLLIWMWKFEPKERPDTGQLKEWFDQNLKFLEKKYQNLRFPS